MVPFMSHARLVSSAALGIELPACRKPIGTASGISLGLIIVGGAAAILAFHAISFLAQIIATPIILAIGVGVAVHIVLYGPKESLKCATELLEKAPRALQVGLAKAPALLEHTAHVAVRILPKALQRLESGVKALPVSPYLLQAIQTVKPQKKSSIPVRILQNIHSKLTPKLHWLANKTASLPFKAAKSIAGVIVTPIIYGVVALAVLHIALRPEPSKKIAKATWLATPSALYAAGKTTLAHSTKALKNAANSGSELLKSIRTSASRLDTKIDLGASPCSDL